jgi:hypothetical protein
MEASKFDIIRFDNEGHRVGRKKFQVSSSTQDAPFNVHGRFDAGEEVWVSVLVYRDGMTLLEVHRTPDFPETGAVDRGLKVFLIYPDEDCARSAGWKI